MGNSGYCRQVFLVRQCGYWHGSCFKIVIVDGLPQALSEELINIIRSLEDIKYEELPTKSIARLHLGASLI